MSAEQKRSILLVFGYVNITYQQTIPIQLTKIILSFYDEHFYWTFKDSKLTNFINAEKATEIVCGRTFKIKGLQFEISVYPNGTIKGHNGLIVIAMKIKNVPLNIEYIQVYREIKCEAANPTIVIKKVSKITHTKNKVFRRILCQLSDLKDLKLICFDFMMNIKYIKYKEEFNKTDYYVPINKMRKYYKFHWNIDGLLMKKCKNIICEEAMYSDSFENNNWCIILYPNGRIESHNGQAAIYLRCLSMPYLISAIDVKFKFDFNGIDPAATIPETVRRWKGGTNMIGFKNVFSFIELKQKESFSITVTLAITHVQGKRNQQVNETDWNDYGIIRNKFTF